MNKETFLDLASKLFDQTIPQNEEVKILLDEATYDEVVDQITSELFESGMDIVEDYELEMYSNEVTLERVNFNLRRIESTIKEVLDRYFEIK